MKAQWSVCVRTAAQQREGAGKAWNLPLVAPACLEVFLHLILCVFLGNRIKPKLFVLLLHNTPVLPPLQLIGWGKQQLSERWPLPCFCLGFGFCGVRWTQSWPSLRKGQRCWVSKGQASSIPLIAFHFFPIFFAVRGSGGGEFEPRASFRLNWSHWAGSPAPVLFWDRVSLNGPAWPWTCYPPCFNL